VGKESEVLGSGWIGIENIVALRVDLLEGICVGRYQYQEIIVRRSYGSGDLIPRSWPQASPSLRKSDPGT
jgi:hypothetical protein